MQRLVKVLPKTALVPELGYLVFTSAGLIAWNGTVGIIFFRERAGTRIMGLVDQHGPIVIQNGAKFLKVLSVLDKVDSLRIVGSHLVIKANDQSTEIKFSVLVGTDIPQALPHLALDWNLQGGTTVPIDRVWIDALDFLTNEGAVLWGDVVGVYDRPLYSAAFDYGLLLYSTKKQSKFHRLAGEVATLTRYCPWVLLQLGLSTMREAVFKGDTVFLVGDGVVYFTLLAGTSGVLDQLLSMQKDASAAAKYKVLLKFSSNIWKRAKLFNKVVLTLSISGGVITLSGGSWSEIIGSTDAPDQTFVTRISLLQKWALKTLGHQFAITADGSWLLLGRTRNESAFYGALTMVKPVLESGDTESVEVQEASEEDSNLEETGVAITELL